MADNRSNASPQDPPAANQGADEPIPATADEAAQAGPSDPVREAEEGASLSAHAAGDVTTPGDAQGVVVPSEHAAVGSSEQATPVQDVAEMTRSQEPTDDDAHPHD